MQARIYISGFVQGVGFRYFVKANARKLGLTGWVQNTASGKVEVLVQGSRESIEGIIKLCEKGPFLSEVKTVDVSWEEEGDLFLDFETIH